MHARNVSMGPDGKPPKRRHFLSYKRRWVVWGGLFLLIASLIFYNWLTQDHRVRAAMERSLTGIIGGPVTIAHASFSIAGGLEVRGVTVSVDDQARDDSTFLIADSLSLRINYARLLQRRLEFQRIEASGVRVILAEDPQTDAWNIRRLFKANRERREREQPSTSVIAGPSTIPEFLISNARVLYLRRVDGALVSIGDVGIDANIFPMPGRRLAVRLLTDPHAGIGPITAVGMFDANTGETVGRISELNFNEVLRTMLPSRVGRWFDDLDFAGRFSVPRFTYRVGAPGERDHFLLDFLFHDTRARLAPRFWMTARDQYHRTILLEAVRVMELLGMDQQRTDLATLGQPDDDVYATDVMSYIALRARLVPLQLSAIKGEMRLSEDVINLEKLSLAIQGQEIDIDGVINGYDPTAPGKIRFRNAPGTYISIPPSRQFMAWLPENIRRTYLQFQPEGKGLLNVQLTRATVGGPIEPVVIVSIFDTTMQFDDFPYPLRKCTGELIFSRDVRTDDEILRMQVKGYGIEGGPNANSTVEIAGDIGPFIDGQPGVEVRVKGENITSERAIREMFPPDVAKAMEMFGPPDYGYRRAASADGKVELSDDDQMLWPQFFGDFSVQIQRDPGLRKNVNTNVELRLKKASGTLRAFPYPMEGLSAVVRIIDDGPGPNRLELEELKMSRNGANLTLSGIVHFTDPVQYKIKANALSVPVNDDLLSALPPTERQWLQRSALSGRIDISGDIFSVPGKDPKETDTDFDLALKLRDVELLHDAKGPAITKVNGPVQLEPARLRFTDIAGRRGDATLKATGAFDWADGSPDVELKLAATDLLLDKALRDILPEGAQKSIDANRPDGTVDIDLHYTVATPPAKKGMPLPAGSEDIELILRPRKLAAMPDVFLYRLEDLGGEIYVKNNFVRLTDLTGRHGQSEVYVNGEGVVGDAADFSLEIDARNVAPDKELLVALPEAVADVLTSLEAKGLYSMRFDKFHVRNSPKRSTTRPAPPPRPSTKATTQPTEPLDIDFACEILTEDGSLNVGLPVAKLIGSTTMTGEVRESNLTQLDGRIFSKSYEMLGRPGTDLTAKIRRPLNFEGVLIQSLKTNLAGGVASGDVTLLTPTDGPSQYAVSMVFQNADLATVAGDSLSKPTNAKLSASFDVEGVMSDTGSRRGRGNVSIVGQKMYEAPIVLGFFRLVNFALPVRDGVNQVDLSYTLVRDRATFDSIEMKAPGLRIYGDGVLDFEKRTVDFTLNTENPDSLSIPLFNQLVRRAQKELLQIHIHGSMQEPKINAMTLPTFQTTLDQVLQDVRTPRN